MKHLIALISVIVLLALPDAVSYARSVTPVQDSIAIRQMQRRMAKIRRYRPTVALVLSGGGAKGALWRQITADCLGMELQKQESSDSSLGSAMLAGIAIGVFKDAKDAVSRCVKIREITEPNLENTKKYADLFKEYKKIHDALAPIYNER
jgi:sugar (pentulose or hexulose) kinase